MKFSDGSYGRCYYCDAPLWRGSYKIERKRGQIDKTACRSLLDCFNRIFMRNSAMYKVGQRMSNIMYNLSQNPNNRVAIALSSQLVKDWDEAKH